MSLDSWYHEKESAWLYQRVAAAEPDSRKRPRSIEFGLQQRVFRVEHFNLGDDAGLVSLAHDATSFGRGTHRVPCGGHRGTARLDVERALAHFDREDGIEFGEPLPGGLDAPSGLCNIGCGSAAIPQRPSHVDRRVPGVVPLVGTRENLRVRSCVIHAARHGQVRHLAGCSSRAEISR